MFKFKHVFLAFLIFSSLTGFASGGIVYQVGWGDGFSAYTEVYSDGKDAFIVITYETMTWPAHLGPVCEGFWNYPLEEKPFKCYLQLLIPYYSTFYFDGRSLYLVDPFLKNSSEVPGGLSHPLFYHQNDSWIMVFFGEKEPLVWRFDKNCVDYLGVGNYTREQRSPTTTPVEGVLENDAVIFSNGSQTYVIPVEELEPYFNANFTVKYLEGVFLKKGILFYPAVYQGIWGITSWQHDYSKVVLFGKEEGEAKLLNTSSLKPFPLFFYDGKNLKVFRIFRIVENGTLEVFVEKNFFTHWPKCIYRNVTKTVTMTTTKTITETREHTKTVTETKREEGICGVGALFALSLLPLVLRRRIK
ncbi:MAG: hypothetical protein J7K57_04445 [Palaeococcus sp.]|uniref:hypothetical protein n=1 Tax=Palaeococcus sp. (in: euryarchaeotes) TaxID=2820298 RepID=UPI0025E442F6|nr:hypothetical protein [Palaeococcus sp. (in: euryarchaeotes)]MCD6559106.1 hypothetical protein [Palaeococcus sp. (in: euryarchaeotes)]